jgi:peroxiredoxin
MPVDRITLIGNALDFVQTRPDIQYKGMVSGGKIEGTFTLLKHSRSLPLTLKKVSSNPSAPGVPVGLRPVAARKAAPDFALLDSKDATLKLSDYKGKVVLLDFWATYCGVCKTEIPWYEQFRSKYRSRGFAVVGVSMDTGWKAVRPFMAAEKMNYPVVIGSWGLLGRFGMHVKVLPITFLIDRDGRIADRHLGLVNKDRFEGEIERLLHEKR